MPDLSLPWQGDLRLTPDGDLALVDGIPLDNQHIERRLLTAVKGYPWHQGYGAGIPQRVGSPAKASVIRALVRAQLALEATVARVPLPTIKVDLRADGNGLCAISITYTNAISGTSEEIALEIPTGR